MEIVMVQIEPWAFMYDLIIQICFFVVMPVLLVISFHKRKWFKTLLITACVYSFIVITAIFNLHSNDFNYARDVENRNVETSTFFIDKVYMDRGSDYFIIEDTKYKAVSRKAHNDIRELLEGHQCEVEYYSTSHKVIRIKVID